MKDLIAKLKVAQKDADTKKALESFGITEKFLNEVKTFENPVEKPETLDDALDNFGFKPEFDRRITKAVNTNTDNLKEKFEFVPKEQDEKDDKKDKANALDLKDFPKDHPVMQMLTQMQEKLTNLEKEKAQETVQSKKQKALELLSSKSIPEVYASKFDLDKPLEEQLEEIETAFEKDTETILKRTNPNGSIKLPNPSKNPGNKVNPEQVNKFKQNFKL